tara:strand:+ start:1272 stop:1547 length:276 start_codon:yes stop_codon:yes gene_type:complete
MAFSRTGINPIGGQSKKGTAPQMWTYTSVDAIATVNSAGYFNDMTNELSVGDVIFVHDSNTPTMSIVMVASNASSVVDVTDGTTVAMTDSD